MRVIIAGGRDITDAAAVEEAIAASGYDITEVVCGGLTYRIAGVLHGGTTRRGGIPVGIDTLGAEWAKRHDIPVKMFPARWDEFGRSAGPRRNTEMARYAEALIAVWDGQSRGTAHMIRSAREHGLLVHVHAFTGPTRNEDPA